MNPRRSRGFFICGQSSILLACASCRASTICRSRKFYYLLPMNRFRIFSSSVVLLPCPHPVDAGCSPPSSPHTSTPFPHNILGAKIPGFAQFRVLLVEYQTALPFESAHETGHIHFLRYFHQQMHWSRHTLPLRFLSPISQRSQTFSYLSSFFSIEFLSAILLGKYDVVLAILTCIP